MLSENGRLFVMGGGFGLFCAVVGALVDYVLARRRGNDEREGLPGCMLLMAGGLGIAGCAAIGMTFLVLGSVWPAVVVGAGVGFGFFCGFTILFLMAVFLSSRQVDFLE